MHIATITRYWLNLRYQEESTVFRTYNFGISHDRRWHVQFTQEGNEREGGALWGSHYVIFSR
jgi:hypothetical protein